MWFEHLLLWVFGGNLTKGRANEKRAQAGGFLHVVNGGAYMLQAEASRALALSRTRSLWAGAMRTTLGGLPGGFSRWRKAMKSGS